MIAMSWFVECLWAMGVCVWIAILQWQQTQRISGKFFWNSHNECMVCIILLFFCSCKHPSDDDGDDDDGDTLYIPSQYCLLWSVNEREWFTNKILNILSSLTSVRSRNSALSPCRGERERGGDRSVSNIWKFMGEPSFSNEWLISVCLRNIFEDCRYTHTHRTRHNIPNRKQYNTHVFSPVRLHRPTLPRQFPAHLTFYALCAMPDNEFYYFAIVVGAIAGVTKRQALPPSSSSCRRTETLRNCRLGIYCENLLMLSSCNGNGLYFFYCTERCVCAPSRT